MERREEKGKEERLIESKLRRGEERRIQNGGG
jgi:hypothetical protein